MSTMTLSIRHTTHYAFAQPVVHALQRLRLTPKETQGQRIVDWAMTFDNAHAELQYDDQHFNHVTLIGLAPGAHEVMVTCKGTVVTEDNAGVIGRHSGHLPLWSFLRQTPLTRPGAKLRALLREVAGPGSGGVDSAPLDFLHALSALIRERVAYEAGRTHSATTAEESVGHGAGVCQDHAHVIIGAARTAGIPARYVSGYLMMDDRIGSLEAGKEADVLVIDRRGETQLSPPAALIPNLVYGNGPSPDAVHRVMVRGKTVVKDGEHVSVDRRAAVHRSDALQETLLDEVDARGFVRKRTRFTWH